MRIGSIELQDEGEYICTAENGVGRVSGSVSVTVQGKEILMKFKGSDSPSDFSALLTHCK